jgi:hypothetical protein
MGAVEDQSIQGAIDEARKRGCRQLPTESNLVQGLQEWLADIREEVERFGASAGAPCWNLRIWDADVPSFCVFESLTKKGEVELSFFIVAESPRDVINWCEREAPTGGKVAAARKDFHKRWGEPFATTTVKASLLGPPRKGS